MRFAARQDHSAFNEILQFADISRPFACCEGLHSDRRNRLNFLLHLFCKFLREITDQERDIFVAIPQGWDTDRKNVQAVKQVAAKLARHNHFLQLAVRGGH